MKHEIGSYLMRGATLVAVKIGTWTFDFSTARLGKRNWPLALLGWNTSFSGVPHCLTRYSSAKVSVSISILRRAIFAFEAEEDDGRKSCENIQTIFIDDICIPPLGLVAAAATHNKLELEKDPFFSNIHTQPSIQSKTICSILVSGWKGHPNRPRLVGNCVCEAQTSWSLHKHCPLRHLGAE